MNRLKCMGLSALFCVNLVYGAINLNNFYSNGIQRLATYATQIDTLEWNTVVTNGQAQSKLTIAAKPILNNYYYMVDTVKSKNTVDTVISPTTDISPISPENIEMTLGFSLPQDFVVKNMWLWIDGKRVKALIQSKNLAQQQYQKIVGARKDPALLEYSSNGYYNLRIYPAICNKTRKIEIEFQHTFTDDSLSGAQGLITAAVPVAFDFTNDTYVRNKPFVRASFLSSDSKKYSVSFPGAGSGQFSSSKELILQSSNLSKLDAGVISAPDPSGSKKYLWIGNDTIKKVYTTGFSTEISDTSVIFENEPDTRIIVLDIRNQTWDWDDYYSQGAKKAGSSYSANYYTESQLWQNAQKYAILCLRQYLTSNQKFNVIIGGDSVRSIFDTPVMATADNIKKAMLAIRAAVPSKNSSTVNLMKEAIEQTPNGVVILISDLFQPYNYFTQSTGVKNESGVLFDRINDSLKTLIMKSDITLFSIDDNYNFYEIARLSGGYRLADLLYKYNVAYIYKIVDGKRVAVPQLPALFGSANYSGFQRVAIESKQICNIIYTFDTPVYWYGGSAMVDAVSLSAPRYYPVYNNGNLKLRIAGQIEKTIPNSLTVNVQGKMGGLRFKKEISAAADYNPILSDLQSDVQYAFRNTEMLYNSNYSANAKQIKEIGKQYGILTSQTSLLALEPGMVMWDDSVFVGNSAVRIMPQVTTDMMLSVNVNSSALSGAPVGSYGTGFDIESLGIDDLMNLDALPVFNITTRKSIQEMSVSVQRNIITIRLPMKISDISTLNLFDLKGRLVIRKVIDASAVASGVFHWNIANECKTLGKGYYVFAISTGSQKNLFKIALTGR